MPELFAAGLLLLACLLACGTTDDLGIGAGFAAWLLLMAIWLGSAFAGGA